MAIETIVAGFVPANRSDVVASLAVLCQTGSLMCLIGWAMGGIEGNSPFAGRQHWQEEECRKDPFHVHHPLRVAGKGQRDVDRLSPPAYTRKSYHHATEMKVLIADISYVTDYFFQIRSLCHRPCQDILLGPFFPPPGGVRPCFDPPCGMRRDAKPHRCYRRIPQFGRCGTRINLPLTPGVPR